LGAVEIGESLPPASVRIALSVPPLATVNVSLLLLRVTLSTPLTPPLIAVVEESALAPLKVALTALP
jgi:hypothetical protein